MVVNTRRRFDVNGPVAVVLASLVGHAAPAVAQPTTPPAPIRNVVLVHGAFADGSGWKSVTSFLQKAGFNVAVVQEPEVTLDGDAAAVNRVLDTMPGPTVLVGHSYGGAVVTVAGNHPNVARLVYAAAFAPDEGETVDGLEKSDPPAAKGFVVRDGFMTIEPSKFAQDFAADVEPGLADFMAISQVPEGVATATTPIKDPAWKHKPSWAIVALDDRMINPNLERKMYARMKADITEIKSSHAVYIARPFEVAQVIMKAARNER